MNLLAIDPGPQESGVVFLREGKIEWSNQLDFLALGMSIHATWSKEDHPQVLCEAITPQLPKKGVIGTETIETAYVIGDIRGFCRVRNIPFHLIARRDVKRALALGTANDALVIAELKARGWVKGTKKNPGPAYGVKGHCWQALALAVAWTEMQGAKR